MTNIYYGIQGKFVKKNISKWINITGEPNVFVVRDENLHMFQEKFMNKYDVVSLEEALNRYPDAQVWITYRDMAIAKRTAQKLLRQVSSERIHFLEADLEYRKSCKRLGQSFYYTEKGTIPLCTVGNRRHPYINSRGSVKEAVMEWQDFSQKLIYANQRESPNKCKTCPLLSWGFYPKTVKIVKVRFLQSLAMDACNFKCIYCSAAKKGTLGRNKKREGSTTCDVLRTFAEMPEYVAMGEEFTVNFANGELCANKYFDEIMKILLSNKWRIELLSNLSIYRQEIADLMQTGRIRHVITSLDAGTRETFYKIKGNDRFDIVVENLKRYPLHKTDLLLKYIFLKDINDNEADVDGFCAIAKESGATIQISADNTTNAIPFTQDTQMREMTLRMIRRAKADGVKVRPEENNTNPKDVAFIRESYQNA